MQDILIKKGVTEHRYEHGVVRVHAPRDITLKEWEPPFQKFLASMEKREAVKSHAS